MEQRYILVIDDQPAVAELVRLAVPEYKVLYAENGVLGLDRVRSDPNSLALILLDIHMRDGFDGRATLVQLCGLELDIPVRIITGYGTNEITKLSRELTGFYPIAKPIDIDLLSDQIRKTIQIGRLSDAIRPARAVLTYVQELVSQAERDLREKKQERQIIIAASSTMALGGLKLMLDMAGVCPGIMVQNLSSLSAFVKERPIIITTYDDAHDVQRTDCPFMCLTDSLSEAFDFRDNFYAKGKMICSVVVYNENKKDCMVRLIRFALERLAFGESYCPQELINPLEDVQISCQERKLVVAAIRKYDIQTTARLMVVSPDSVRKLRSRLCEKLDTDDLVVWGQAKWFECYPEMKLLELS